MFDQEDKSTNIHSKNDLWFIRENAENIDIINKYIILFSNILKKENILEMDIIKEIESFIDTTIGTKLTYIISILNKFYLPNYIYILFLGFIIGEKKDFIKRNYILNLQDLILRVEPKISFHDKRLHIYSFTENSLKILNIFFFFEKFLRKQKYFIDTLKDAFIIRDTQDFNLSIYYNKIAKEELLEKLFYTENDNFSSIIYKTKVLNILESIKGKIEDFSKLNQEIFNDELSNEEESLKEINKMIDFEEGEEEEEEEEGKEEEEEKKKKTK